jgi:glycosyltransferase involved in cell wall biosynthesis
MANPLVSICCITYNHGLYIKQCLDGFLTQKTSFDYEILIHDDASTDNTANIIKEYEKIYPNIIKPIYQTENQYSKGVRPINKFNFLRAKGKYIAMCEGDDYWTYSYKLQKQFDFLEQNPEFGGVSTNNRIFYQKENFFEDSVFEEEKITFEDLCSSNKINSQTALFKKDLVQNLDWMQGLKIGDWALHLMVTSQQPYYRLADITTVYRIHSGGVHSLLDEEIKLRRRVEVLLAVNQNFELSAERQTVLNSSIAELFKRLLNFKAPDIRTTRKKYIQFGGTYFNKTMIKSFLNEYL